MGTCKDCVWWNLLEAHNGMQCGECTAVLRFHLIAAKTVGAELIAVFAASADVLVKTREDFGCNQFEVKESGGGG